MSAKLFIHDFDYVSSYCKRCGMALSFFKETLDVCNSGPNVIAISHIRAHQRMNGLLGDIEDMLEKP